MVLTQLWLEISSKANLLTKHQSFKMLRKHFMDAMSRSIDETSYSQFDFTLALIQIASPEFKSIDEVLDARDQFEKMLTQTVMNLCERGLNSSVMPLRVGSQHAGKEYGLDARGECQDCRRMNFAVRSGMCRNCWHDREMHEQKYRGWGLSTVSHGRHPLRQCRG